MRKCVSRIVVVGLALGAWVGSSIAQTITNPSFEADTFTAFPGYISGNAPITGWTAGNPSRAGLNPSGGSPFANNGVIPNGANVAFIQNAADSSLSNVITGLTIGETYKVNFRVNARDGNTPNLKVDIDGINIINSAVTSVGGASAYKYFAFDFTATAAEHLLALRNDAGGDNTVVIDDFSIAVRNSGWSYAAWTDNASAGVDNTKTYTHAFNFGTAVSATINGVVFAGVNGANPSGPTFSTTGLGAGPLNGDANNLNETGSRELANDFVYNGFPATITINGLIPGAEYVANIYSVGWENGTRAATFSVGNDRLTVNQDHFGDNNGIRFTYRYIASGSSITLTYSPLQGNSIHTYGFSNYELNAPPTPPAVVLNPSSRCVSAGQPLVLSGSASGSPAPTYQWQKDGSDLNGQTNSVLNISPASASDAGEYRFIASNGSGSATSTVATVLIGLAMVNPSFEADTFTFFPGYVSGNGPITGWSSLGNHGINPASGSPFADNGVIPDGIKTAFMQGDGALSQMVGGFTIGEQYYVIYYENARLGGVPAVQLQIGGNTIVPTHSRSPVGGSNPYALVTSDPFIATATDLLLSFIKSNPNGGDTTALIDNVCVLALPAGTPPSVNRAPQSVTVSVGENAAFTVGAFGSLPITYQWRKDGADILDATNNTLSLNAVVKSAEADYTVVLANGSGSVTSAVARLTVYEPIPTLFNTGLDTNRVALADGLIDPHYTLLSNPDTGSPDAIVEDSTQFPIVGGPWLLNTASSKWIGPRLNTAASAVGFYTNRTTFDLTDRDPATVVIIGRWASDNSGRDIRVNGVSTGNPQSTTFAGYTGFLINTSNAAFLPGLNTIDFVVENEGAPGYTGLRVEFTASNARILPNIPPTITLHPVSQPAVIESNSVTFTVNSTGSDPITYQWTRNGTPLPGQTNATLTLVNLTTNDNGLYAARATNDFGFADSDPATLAVIYRRVPGIYGTGLNNDGTLAADSSIDLHWILGSSADLTNTGPDAIVIDQGNSPVGPWIAAGPRSKWIAPRADQNGGNAEGNYTYQTFFDLTGVDMCTFRLAGQFAVDNSLLDIVVNGVSQGVSGGGFTSFTPFVVTNGFVAGPNTVDFIINNAPVTPNPTALRVDLDGLVLIRDIVAPTLSIKMQELINVDGPTTTKITVQWGPTNACDRLQVASEVTGPWEIIGTTSPYITTFTNGNSVPALFFRVLP
jgi:hypothetical protein